MHSNIRTYQLISTLLIGIMLIPSGMALASCAAGGWMCPMMVTDTSSDCCDKNSAPAAEMCHTPSDSKATECDNCADCTISQSLSYANVKSAFAVTSISDFASPQTSTISETLRIAHSDVKPIVSKVSSPPAVPIFLAKQAFLN
ncbi:MAG: hypothetical protein LAT57_06730 [Balneolales bacterium]|nr:hypothetical protein [Balneolales bacterium]